MDHSEEWACTAQRGDKTFCGAPSVAMAPFPICVAHLARTYEFLSATLTNEQAEDDAREAEDAGLVRPMTLTERPLPPAPLAKTHAPPRLYTAADPAGARVYYLMLGGLVKIGVVLLRQGPRRPRPDAQSCRLICTGRGGSPMAKRRGRSGGGTRGTANKNRTVLSAQTKQQKSRKGAFLVRHFAPKARAPLTTKTGKPTPHALGAKRWGEPVPKTKAAEAKLYAKGQRLLAQARR